MKQQPTLVDSIFIGDRVVDVCGAIGVYCKAMVTGTVPMIEERYPFSRQLECVLCIMGEKRSCLYHAAKSLNTGHIVLENSGEETNPAAMAGELRERGYSVDVIDFTGPVREALRQAGALFAREEMAEKRASRYEKELEEARAAMPRNLDMRVLVLMGLSHPRRPESYLLAELPGGDADELILKPGGCVSVGEALAENGPMGLGFAKLDGLDALAEAAPDMIALVCDASVGQQALHRALLANPALASVPALARQAIFSLPSCSQGAPVGIPGVMRRWTQALAAASQNTATGGTSA